MKKHAALLLVALLFFCCKSNAQVLPQPGAVLNYTQVMFEYPRVKGASHYVLQLVHDTTGPLFAKPQMVVKDSTTATMVSGLKFGRKYLWRYAGVTGGKQQPWNGPYNFEIVVRGDNDKNAVPVTVVQYDSFKSMGGLITADFQCIINRAGIPVWQMPMVSKSNAGTINTRDLRVTAAGTITFLNAASKPVECDLMGKILWQAPQMASVSGDTSEFYHHDFQRLPNGNYMVLGDKYVWKKIPGEYQQQLKQPVPMGSDTLHPAPNLWFKTINGELYAKLQYGTIIEYNTDGGVVWSWDAENYLTDAEVFPLLAMSPMPMPGIKPVPGMPLAGATGIAVNDRDAHLNAFTVDNSNEFVYAGFRQLSRIIKIEKRTGKVVYSWGKNITGAAKQQGEGFFAFQHGLDITRNGNLLVFDNGGISAARKPSRAVIFNHPVADTTDSKIVWSFDCVFDTTIAKSHRAGNAEELPNGNILVCTGTGALAPLPPMAPPGAGGAVGINQPARPPMAPAPGNQPISRIFEVTPDKQLVWSSTISPFQRSPYRAHYVSSLYPCYFTVGLSADTFTSTTTINVFNEGTESDSYLVSANFTGSGLKQTFDTYTVGAGKVKQITLNPALLPQSADKVMVIVQSVSNPAHRYVVTIPFLP